jgi:hypothetical protein
MYTALLFDMYTALLFDMYTAFLVGFFCDLSRVVCFSRIVCDIFA